MTGFYLFVLVVYILHHRYTEKQFRKSMLFQIQELHIRLSAKQDRKGQERVLVGLGCVPDKQYNPDPPADMML